MIKFNRTLIALQQIATQPITRRDLLSRSALLPKKSWDLIGVKFYTQSTAAVKVDKSLLTTLRKHTGYPLKKCNDALAACENDYEKAKGLLVEQATKEGWAKANKVSNRATSQGLCGVMVRENFVSLVELGCETDFVARNELFKELVTTTTEAALDMRQRILQQNARINSLAADGMVSHVREDLILHDLLHEPLAESNTLQSELVAIIGKLGENIKLKRAIAVATPKENNIQVATHGSVNGTLGDCHYGSFAAVVFLKPLAECQVSDLDRTGKLIAQHIIGMNPTSVSDGENALLSQDFMFDEKLTVAGLCQSANVSVVDFLRFGVGS